MNLTPILKKKYPEGSIGPGSGKYQGECISYCHAIAEFGTVGDTLAEKQRYVRANGIIAGNISEVGKGFRVGDVVITSEGKVGHGFIVADMDEQNLYAAESNFRLDKRVRYGRRVAKNDPKIYGIIRAPLLIDLGLLELNVSVFINNQPKWNLGIFDSISQKILTQTGGKLKINFFPLRTNHINWWYETFPFNGVEYKVIAKAYLDEKMQLSFTNQNKPSDICVFLINPKEWEGSASGAQEFAWTTFGKPGQIQASCAEFDVSPWYFGKRLVEHILVHELSHHLHYINGLNDTTDLVDYPPSKRLEDVFSDLDFNRVVANI